MSDFVEILRVTGAFGIRGAVRAVFFTQNLTRYKLLYNKNGEAFSFRILKFCGKNRAVISLENMEDRDAAESLRHELFYVKRSDLPPIEKNEVYLCDIINQSVKVIGSGVECKIVNVANFGAGDLVELSYEDSTFFVPFTVENFPDSCDQIFITSKAFNEFKN